MRIKATLAFTVIASFWVSTANSATITLEEYGLFLSSPDFSQNVQDSHIYWPTSNLGTQHLGLTIDNQLGPNSLGTFSWTVENQASHGYQGINAVVYLDAAIDRDINTFFNENATWMGNAQATSWEADDPWYPDIQNNVASGQLTNQNWVAPGFEGDVALALGFYIPELKQGDAFTMTMSISMEDIGGWYHFDPDSDFGFYFNSTLEFIAAEVPVPEPSALALLALGLGGLGLARRRNA